MNIRSLMRMLWTGAFLVWTLVYLCAATEFGVLGLYVLLAEPGDPHGWILLAFWLAGATAGGWITVAMIKLAFGEARHRGEADA